MMQSRAGGYALVAVLWLITLLTLVTLTYQASARVETRLVAQSIHGAQAEAAAEGGLWLAAHDFFTGATSSGGRPPAVAELDVALGETPVHVVFADVAGKINLNGAPPELLESLLAHANVPPAERTALVASILDWRDADHAQTPNGAEDATYLARGNLHGAKDAPFATIDELRYLPAMTDATFRRIAPAITVLGEQGMVNVDAAAADVLLALSGDDRGVVDAILRARASEAEVQATEGLDSRFASTGMTSDIWFVTANATVSGANARIVAALRYARGEAEPVQVLSWENAVD
jgi:general secretion pathway protein K